jgi:ABC-type transport system involved in multi-copper enzyme maturation permease subunit
VDTWRQSRQQVVFIVMLAVMALALLAGITLPRPIIGSDGEKHFGTILSGQPDRYFARQWVNEYARTLGAADDFGPAAAMRSGAGNQNLNPAQRREQIQQYMQEQQRLRQTAADKASGVPEYRRAVEYYIHTVVGLMFRATLLLFIAACAGYFPGMLATGAIDIVLAKPISRLQIYWSRYLSGITLYGAAITAFCALLFVGVGLRTGIYHGRIFFSIPLLVFTAMLLYSLLAFIGTVSRSATMAMLIGYVFYVVVDTVIGGLMNFQPMLEQMGWESVATVISVMRNVLPNFGMMNDMALASLLNMPAFEFRPFAVALAWLMGSFCLGYWVFKRRDY